MQNIIYFFTHNTRLIFPTTAALSVVCFIILLFRLNIIQQVTRHVVDQVNVWVDLIRTNLYPFRYMRLSGWGIFSVAALLIGSSALLDNIAEDSLAQLIAHVGTGGVRFYLLEYLLYTAIYQVVLVGSGTLIIWCVGQATNSLHLDILEQMRRFSGGKLTRSQKDGPVTDVGGIEKDAHDLPGAFAKMGVLLGSIIYVLRHFLWVGLSMIGVVFLIMFVIAPLLKSKMRDLKDRRGIDSDFGRGRRDAALPNAIPFLQFVPLSAFILITHRFLEQLRKLNVQAFLKERGMAGLVDWGQTGAVALLLAFPFVGQLALLLTVLDQLGKAQGAISSILDVIFHEGLGWYTHSKRLLTEGIPSKKPDLKAGTLIPPRSVDIVLKGVKHIYNGVERVLPDLTIPAGTLNFVVGDRYSGRGTFLKHILTGMKQLVSGEVLMGGFNVREYWWEALIAFSKDGQVFDPFGAWKKTTVRAYLRNYLGFPLPTLLGRIFNYPLDYRLYVERLYQALALDISQVAYTKKPVEEMARVVREAAQLRQGRKRDPQAHNDLVREVQARLEKLYKDAMDFVEFDAVTLLQPKGMETSLTELGRIEPRLKAVHYRQLALAGLYLQAVVMGTPVILLDGLLSFPSQEDHKTIMKIVRKFVAVAGKTVIMKDMPINDDGNVILMDGGTVVFYGRTNTDRKHPIYPQNRLMGNNTTTAKRVAVVSSSRQGQAPATHLPTAPPYVALAAEVAALLNEETDKRAVAVANPAAIAVDGEETQPRVKVVKPQSTPHSVIAVDVAEVLEETQPRVPVVKATPIADDEEETQPRTPIVKPPLTDEGGG